MSTLFVQLGYFRTVIDATYHPKLSDSLNFNSSMVGQYGDITPTQGPNHNGGCEGLGWACLRLKMQSLSGDD